MYPECHLSSCFIFNNAKICYLVIISMYKESIKLLWYIYSRYNLNIIKKNYTIWMVLLYYIWFSYLLPFFISPSLRRDVLWYINVRLFVCPFHMSCSKSPTIWWIKSHNSGMKNWNFTKKYTDRKTINSNNSVKFEVNWPRGS
jgi:hypothetical protein